MEAAKTSYQDSTKGTAFNSILAWQKLRYAPKWRVDHCPEATPTVPPATPSSGTPNNLDDALTDSTVTGISPSECSATSISRPIGGKAAKKHCIKEYNHNELISQAGKLTNLSKDRLDSLNTRNDILKMKNEISLQERLKIEGKKQVLEEEH